MGLIRGVARTAAIAGTATAVSNRVSRRQANRGRRTSRQPRTSSSRRMSNSRPRTSPPQRARATCSHSFSNLGSLRKPEC
jgi:hypothetical protein